MSSLGLLSYFSRKKALTATPAVLETMAARQFSPYISLGGTNLNSQRVGNAYVKVQNGSYGWLYLYSPPVRRVVDYVARNVSQLGLKCYERVSDDEREHRGDHPAAEALRHPNPQTPGNYFVQEFVKCHLVFGNAYALKFRPSPGSPLTLVLLNPSMVGIVGQSHFQADAYRIYMADGQSFDVPPEDILRWPNTTGDDPRCGESYLETLRESIAADVAAQTAVTELHRSGLVFNGWIERDIEAPEWTEEARKRFQESWTNQARDGRKHTPVLEEGMQFKQAGVTPENAQFIKSRELTLAYVASLFGMKDIPPETEEARRQFYADVLPPFCELMCSFLDLHILQQEYQEDDYYFEFNLDEKLITDDRLKTLISAAGAPIFTRNESRAIVNKPPVEGGDELITPGNVIVGDNPLPSQGVMPVQNPNKPPQDGSHRSGDADKPMAAGSRSSLTEVEWHPIDLNGNGHKGLLVPVREQANQRRNGWAKRNEGIVARHFNRQRSVMGGKGTKALTDERWNTELADDLNDSYAKQFVSEGQIWARRMASEFDPEQGKNYLKAKAVGAAEDINKTTQEHVAKEGVDDAFDKALVRAVGAGAAMATSVASFATKTALEQTPGESRVVIDGGDCDECAPYQGDWAVEELDAWPAYHANCQCVAVPYRGKSVESEAGTVDILAKALAKAYESNGHNGNGNGLEVLAKAIPELAKAISEQKPPQVTVESPQNHFHEGAMKAETHYSAPELNFDKGAFQHDSHINVEAALPAEVTIEKGAMEVNIEPTEVNVAPSPAPNVNVEPPNVTVEPTEVNVHPPDVKVDIAPTEVNVAPPPPAEVNVNVEQPNVNVNIPKEGKKTVTFSDGRKAEIESD